MPNLAIKRMLIRNPGSPREMAAKRRNQGASPELQVVAKEAQRRLQFNPKRIKPKSF